MAATNKILDSLEQSILGGDCDTDWRRKLQTCPSNTRNVYACRLRILDRYMEET